MRVTVYKCNLCGQSWEADNVFGVKVEQSGDVSLVDPEEFEDHVCRSCIVAIRDFGNSDMEE